MKLVITGNNTLKRIAPAPLTLVERQDVRQRIERRFANETPSAGYQFCRNCTNPIFISDAEHCQPCDGLVKTRRSDIEFRAETKKDLKIIGLTLIVGSIIIAVGLYFLPAWR